MFLALVKAAQDRPSWPPDRLTEIEVGSEYSSDQIELASSAKEIKIDVYPRELFSA